MLLFSFLLTALAAWGQCGQCSPIGGEIIDFCYTDPSLPDRCASFSEGTPYFYFENKSNTKSPVLKFDLPEQHQEAGMAYLLALDGGKKNKLGSADLLFMEHAIQTWVNIEGISRWDAQAVNSGFTLHPSGLAYKTLVKGQGNTVPQGRTVVVHYTGYFADGKKFDSSLDRKQPFRFALGKGQVISGWDEGVALMPIGSRYFFRIPPEMAYGEKGAGHVIPPFATLYFDVQLLAAE